MDDALEAFDEMSAYFAFIGLFIGLTCFVLPIPSILAALPLYDELEF